MKRNLLAIIIVLFLFVPKIYAQTITASSATGTISACELSASASPNLQQITVSGDNLIDDITAQVSSNFEISTSPSSGYTTVLTLPQSGGKVNATIIYVRSAATDATGHIDGNIRFTSTQAGSQTPLIAGDVLPLPTVGQIADLFYNNGDATAPINFTGSAAIFSWTNNIAAIGLPANGTGDILSFTAVNTGSSPVKASITVTPLPAVAGACVGVPYTFVITVNPTLIPAITTTGSLSSLNTIYGTPSTSTIFTVSGANMKAGILVTPPAGFEISLDGSTFSSSITIGAAGDIASTTIYVRLASTTHVGTYQGNVTLTSTGSPDAKLTIPLSSVTPAALAIIADDKRKIFGMPNPVLTASYVGFVNNDTAAQLTTAPLLTTTATDTSPLGDYTIVAGGATSIDYDITYLPGVLTIIAAPSSIVVPNAFTPNGDGVNDTWNVKYLDSYLDCMVNVFNRYGQKVYSSTGYSVPWDGTYKGSKLPVGAYYYVIDLKSNVKLLSGYVTIIR